jgi:ArsR family transcriptional regulator
MNNLNPAAVMDAVDSAACCAGSALYSHEARLRAARERMPPVEELFRLADLFKIFGDTTRIRILYALFETELCVCAIAELLGMTQSATSHQLRVLRESKLVDFRREGKTICYFLADEHVRAIIDQGYEHVTEENGERHG